jgi:sugar lactone lactonase YvrE
MRAVLIPAGFPGLLVAGFILFNAQTANAVQFQITDAVEFSKIIDTNAVFTTNIANLNTLIEGPVWIPNGQYLVFSEVGSNRLMKLVLPSTLTDVLTLPSGAKYNGNILDLQERLISCECGSNGFKVVMTTNGDATVLPVITNNLQRPNGICFSPDEIKLYVADDGINWNLTNIMVYNVTSINTLTGGKIFCSVSGGFAKGFRCDVDG